MNSVALFALAQQAEGDETPVKLIPTEVGLGFAIFWFLVALAGLVWVIAILKALQLGRMRGALHAFEREVFNLIDAKDLFAVAQRHAGSPGARVVLALSKRGGSAKVLESIAKRAIVDEQQRAGNMMTLLASIASSAPFIGLLGTVYGILVAFLRIGVKKSASLPVVAPAIGEALVATLVGLIAAIPALIFYNLLNRRLEDLVSELEAASEAWVTLVAESDQKLAISADRTIAQSRPPAMGQYAGG